MFGRKKKGFNLRLTGTLKKIDDNFIIQAHVAQKSKKADIKLSGLKNLIENYTLFKFKGKQTINNKPVEEHRIKIIIE